MSEREGTGNSMECNESIENIQIGPADDVTQVAHLSTICKKKGREKRFTKHPHDHITLYKLVGGGSKKGPCGSMGGSHEDFRAGYNAIIFSGGTIQERATGKRGTSHFTFPEGLRSLLFKSEVSLICTVEYALR